MKNQNFTLFRGTLWAVFAFAGVGFSQPAPIPTGANSPCQTGPTLITGIPDTVVSAPDSAGFRSIFNGTDLKGWWEDCQSGHSSADRTLGPIWLVDPANKLLFGNQNTNGAGGILATNKILGNYELVFDYWPSFGDDGGVFNRTTATGTCYQTTLDYIGGSSVGGVYFEGGYTGATRNLDPYTFGASSSAINIGTGASNWTGFTATQNPTSFGCSAAGCTVANWTTVWDVAGWNQVRVKFFGTGASAANKVHNQSWIRKFGAANWTPVISDSVQFATAASYLGFQIHGGTGSWSNRNGIWFRNIMMRPLTDLGVPIPQGPTPIRKSSVIRHGVRVGAEALTGTVDGKYEMTLSDVSGRILEKFSGNGGAFRHTFKTSMRGFLILNLKTEQGTESFRIDRVLE